MSDKILVEEKGNTIRVRFMDQILDGNAPELREILADILEKVVIVSSLGISRLLSFKNKADEKKMTVKIVNIQDKLKETLKKLMLDQFFGI
ncbi:anti-sigma factor antagonist [Leptospira ellinghausenii]|uniref:Anti-sigma factor antagonist n=1 Tax=Leptospira ellinghausenii TaxID=1917822 RepID=A0A2P2DF54_9LEPT|nr:STAS domain-containing protein [Leptospira ellinghausenii]GBF43274.1 anti-sigma factor antagonist [Leptospira ellinghausenii]